MPWFLYVLVIDCFLLQKKPEEGLKPKVACPQTPKSEVIHRSPVSECLAQLSAKQGKFCGLYLSMHGIFTLTLRRVHGMHQWRIHTRSFGEQ